MDLIEHQETQSQTRIQLAYKASAPVPSALGDAIYHTVELFLTALTRKGKGVSVSVFGVDPFTLRIRMSGGMSERDFQRDQAVLKAVFFAKNCCKRFVIDHKQVTIITMQYAHQRPSS